MNWWIQYLAHLLSRLNPFTTYPGAIGLTLWRWKRKKVELWWASKHCSPPEHAHDGCSGEFTILWARNRRIYRKTFPVVESGVTRDKFGHATGIYSKITGYSVGGDDSYVAHTPGVWGKWLTVPAGTPHKFEQGDSCMVWLVVETWKEGYEMDLIKDFRLT